MVVHVWAATASGEWDCIDKLNVDGGSELGGGISTAISISNGENSQLNTVVPPYYNKK